MKTQKLGYLASIAINLNADKTLFLFHLQFRGPKQPAVEFEMASDDAMRLMRALQHLQVRHRLPIPPIPRQEGGRPVLRIVEPDA
jgi:hypothetical protein